MLRSEESTSTLSRTVTARADFYTRDESLLILMSMPGVRQDDVNVHLENGKLHVEGTQASQESTTFRRTISVADIFDASQTQASVEHGVVRLEIPKRPEAKSVRIPVNVA